jgi:hypothetical protein
MWGSEGQTRARRVLRVIPFLLLDEFKPDNEDDTLA